VKIRKITGYNKQVRWQIDFGVVNGKRKQRRFDSEKAAEKELKKLQKQQENEGKAGISLSEADRIRFLEAREQLARAGATIEQATAFYLAHAKPSAGTIPMAKLRDACLEAKLRENKRPRYLDQLKCSATSFCKAGHADTPAHSITASEVEHWLFKNNWKPKTQAVYLADLRTVFAWGIARGYLTINPCAAIKPPTLEDKPVEIFEVSTCAQLLKAAAATEAQLGMLAQIAIGLFAGIRPEERLQWSHVHLEDRFIEVPAAIAKTRKRRIVTISENLAAWLELATCRLHRQVAPVAWLVKRRAALLKKAKITVWPHDVLRHSFASYHLAQHGSAEKTSLQLGHHNTQMLFAHYRELVRPADAAAFWEIRP
jgi:integrase/recombinase XerD